MVRAGHRLIVFTQRVAFCGQGVVMNQALNGGHLRSLCMLLVTSVVAGCGGGGGGGGLPTPATPTITVAGTAASGAAMVGAKVYFKCVGTSPESVQTGSDGKYGVNIVEGAFPCLVKAVATDGLTLHSLVLKAGVSNITPLTELTVSAMFAGEPGAVFAGFSTADAAVLSDVNEAAAQAKVRTLLAGLADLSVVANFINTPFTAKTATQPGDAIDTLLDTIGAKLATNNSPIGVLTSQLATGKSITEIGQAISATGFDPIAALRVSSSWSVGLSGAIDSISNLATDGKSIAFAAYKFNDRSVIYQSNDLGATWLTSLAPALIIGGPYLRGDAILFSSGSKNYLSTDRGRTWSASVNPYDPNSFAEFGDGRLVQMAGRVVKRSTRDLINWKDEPATAYTGNLTGYGTGSFIWGGTTDPSFVGTFGSGSGNWKDYWATVKLADGTMVAGTYLGQEFSPASWHKYLYFSRDHGATWAPQQTLRPFELIDVVRRPALVGNRLIAPMTKTTLAHGHGGGAIVVADLSSGISQLLPSPAGTTALKQVAVSSAGVAVIVGDDGTIIRSEDGGATWSTRSSGVTTHLVLVGWGGGKFMAVGANGIVLTSPDGKTWASSGQNSAWNGLTTFIEYHDGTWVVTAQNRYNTFLGNATPGIYESTDAGVSWINRAANMQVGFLARCGSALFAVDWSGNTKKRVSAAFGWVDVPQVISDSSFEVRQFGCGNGALIRASITAPKFYDAPVQEYSLDEGRSWKSFTGLSIANGGFASVGTRWYKFDDAYGWFLSAAQ